MKRKCITEVEIKRKGEQYGAGEQRKFLRAERMSFILALISHAVSDVFDVQRGMQGGKSLN